MKRYFVLAVVALGLFFTACDEEENLNSSVWIGSESESNVIAQLDTLYLDARIENLSGAMRYLWTVDGKEVSTASQCPRKHDKGSPEGYFRITDSQTFVHQYSYHIEDNKREPHTKISGGNPKNRTTASGRSWGFGCFHLYLSFKVVEFGYNRR